ncbi:hypothetical protein GC163_02590 [bacterium]|nr:hypothetical protein [bacterium]
MIPETDLLTDQELEQIEQQLAAATPGPWRHQQCFIEAVANPPQLLGVTIQRSEQGLTDLPGLANGEFIATARSAVPRLISEVRRLRSMLNHQPQRD